MVEPTTSGGEATFPFRRETLENGLEVILHEDRSTPVVAVHLMYHVGSKDEREGRTGFAHLFEHLLFQGSEHVPKGEHFRLVQNAGGTLNGSTWFDRTNYFEILPSNQLELALWLESDRMGHFLPAITQEKLDNQRGVVKNERRQAYENRPYGLAFEEAMHAAFPEGHPYRHPTIGYMEDLDAASLEDVRDFFRDYYGPNNATLVVAGDADPGEALEEVERYFGGFEARETPPPVDVPELEAPGERRTELTDQVAVPRVYLMYHAPSYRDEAFEAADVLSSLLADGKSSRLHRELVYERQVAGEVN
ncbi:MAG: M16 family metallopeptidase, partial [Gemmatimonadota bacterium]